MSASSASTPGIDPRTIAWMTRNEADMSFRMRVRTVFEWIPLQEDSLILDLPCGRGFYLNMLRHVCDCRLVGVDLDWSVLQQAQRTVARLPRLQLSRADAMTLPWAANTFDAIILTELLEHVADDVAVLRECLRVLQPGGVIAITVPHANYPFAWDPINKSLEKLFGTKIRRGPLAGIWANHLRLYTPAQLRARVLQAGFQIEAERAFTHHAFPFSHNLVYGLGKPLLESGCAAGSTDQRGGSYALRTSRMAARLTRCAWQCGCWSGVTDTMCPQSRPAARLLTWLSRRASRCERRCRRSGQCAAGDLDPGAALLPSPAPAAANAARSA